jgi:dienelactone hydrolase
VYDLPVAELIDWNVRSISVRDEGLVGTLFLPSTPPPYPVVITVGGSGGGIFSAPGGLLASRGIAALALAYFGMEHLPRHLQSIPLEYFGTAIRWCRRHVALRSNAIAIAGSSRGGELALLLAATYPEIVAVVGWVASGIIWPGMHPEAIERPVAAWSWNGNDLPFAQIDRRALNWDQRPVRFTPAFVAALSDRASMAAAEIPVERIQGPVLLISGSDDQVWPSKMLSAIAIDRLKRANHPFEFEHLSFEGAGHLIGPPHPFAEPGRTHFNHPTLDVDFEFGGSAELNARASRDAWKRVIEFLQHRFAEISDAEG